MEALKAGSVVVVSFPFSDLSNNKSRPALVLAKADYNDWLLCQITSKSYADKNAIKLIEADFLTGFLHRISFIRTTKVFTANKSIITDVVGQLAKIKFKHVIDHLVRFLKNQAEETFV